MKEENFFSCIENQMRDVEMYEKILSQEGWKLQKDKPNMKISSKVEGNTVGVLIQVFLDVEVQYFMQVLIKF